VFIAYVKSGLFLILFNLFKVGIDHIRIGWAALGCTRTSSSRGSASAGFSLLGSKGLLAQLLARLTQGFGFRLDRCLVAAFNGFIEFF
jgi:hypothetical protein